MNSNAIEIWEKNVERVKKIFAPNLTETEFAFFVNGRMVMGANIPALKKAIEEEAKKLKIKRG